jgi:TPR repeat protein
MLSKEFLGLWSVLGALAIMASAQAQTVMESTAPQLDCYVLTRSPYNSAFFNGTAGVPDHEVKADKAVPACEAAIARAPNDPQMHHELGRAYRAAGHVTRAIEELERAIALGSGSAMVTLGDLYREEPNIRDLAKARYWYERAVAKKDLHAMVRLAEMHMSDPAPDDEAANRLLSHPVLQSSNRTEAMSKGPPQGYGFGLGRDLTQETARSRQDFEYQKP